MRNIKLFLEYDGSNYVGWQRQENGKSVQGEVESVLARLLQEAVTLIGAGRTDAGVHARGQVANFRTTASLSPDIMKRGLNGLLPGDIVVLGAEEAPLEFHSRYSARGRIYSYQISLVPSALDRNYRWYVKYPLDVEKMNKAAQSVLGRHDFESFCRAHSDVKHYCCCVVESGWTADGPSLRYAIQADRYLHGMVRALVGTFVDVGRGYTSLEEFIGILEKRDRKEAGAAAPARGLTLEKVLY